MEKFVPNKKVGGSGGKAFTANGQNGAVVSKIETWHGKAGGDHGSIVCRAIRITWDNGGTSQIFGTQEGERKTLELKEQERIKAMSLWGGDRVDRIKILTDKDQELDTGGTGGDHFTMDVGSGYLQGFSGAAAWDLDSVTPNFVKFKTLTEAAIQQGKPVGGTGGNPFWSCRADSGVRPAVLNVSHGPNGGGDGWYVLRAIKITWSDYTESPWYGTPNSRIDKFYFDLGRGEKILNMTLSGSGRTDRMKFTTDLGNTFAVGGTGGTETIENVGGGILLGFAGKAAWDVDSLAPIFFSK
ncbi:hypothetical protein JMJ35_010183 [Cladonia borealis]|uniref:Jacalin-type lectin domain-containing protein n=1 Tax=Cladonia borealis TaxID=184061 RepID=A0AA39QQ94_9LECA|nr:hypothetical protein JMJ35_010183 [Cladonia borealis]